MGREAKGCRLRGWIRASAVCGGMALAVALTTVEGKAETCIVSGDTSRTCASEAYEDVEAVEYAFDSEVYTVQYGEPMNLLTTILKMTSLILR